MSAPGPASRSLRGDVRGAIPAWVVTAVIVGADAVMVARNPGDIDRLLINAILALSAFATLHARMLSLANAGFMAIGAYGSAILAVKLGLPVSVSIPAAALLCALVALVLGLPVLRLNDVYLAIATLGFGEIVRILIVLLPGLTGGPTGANLSTGFPYDTMKRTEPWMLVLFLALLVYLFAALPGSRTGRAFRALRGNPQAAATAGVDVVSYKSLAFLMSAVIAGFAGAFYAHSVGSLDNGDFRFTRAVDILSYAVLGGSGRWFGPLLGAGLLTALPILIRDGLGASVGFLRGFAQLPNILNGLALMLVIAFLPGGIASVFAPAGVRRGAVARSAALTATATAGPATATPAPGASPPGPAGERASEPLLVVEAVTRVFGGVEALSGVTMTVEPGKIYGLIGPNGAGKTTLLNLISGLAAPTSGRILWRGREIQGRPAHLIAREGISRTYQSIQLFAEMSVRDNVLVGRHAHLRAGILGTWLRLPRGNRQEKAARAQAMSILDRLELTPMADRAAGTLSYGDQRRLEIARALAAGPGLLLLDEPAAGMNTLETGRLGALIIDLKAQGHTLIVVEHHMDLIMAICDEIVVLNFGRKIAQGPPAQVSRDEQVLEAYLGRD